jgi:hypothetical protein
MPRPFYVRGCFLNEYFNFPNMAVAKPTYLVNSESLPIL